MINLPSLHAQESDNIDIDYEFELEKLNKKNEAELELVREQDTKDYSYTVDLLNSIEVYTEDYIKLLDLIGYMEYVMANRSNYNVADSLLSIALKLMDDNNVTTVESNWTAEDYRNKTNELIEEQLQFLESTCDIEEPTDSYTKAFCLSNGRDYSTLGESTETFDDSEFESKPTENEVYRSESAYDDL